MAPVCQEGTGGQLVEFGSKNDKERMNNSCPKRETMSIEDATVSNMWDIAALVEVLERKGHYTKEDLYDIITEFRRFYRVKKYTAPAAGAELSAWLPSMPVA